MNARYPVLMYHGTTDGRVNAPRSGRKYFVSEEKFIDQLAEIRKQNLQVVSLRQARNDNPTAALARPRVVLTFDDGLASSFEHVFPLLLREGMEADFFVNTATIGKPGFINWQQIATMHRFGMSFQSHSHEHVDLTRLPLNVLRRHLEVSKKLLEDRLSCSVNYLAVPFGILNERIIDEARQQGYVAVCNSVSRPTQLGADSINRIAIYRHTPDWIFKRLISQHPLPYLLRKARSALLYLPKNVLLRFQPSRLGVNVSETRT